MAQQSKPPYAVPSRADIDRRPWKYLGWPEFARFAAADDDFFVLRRFDVASARVLLAMQDRVTVLEERLDALDRKYSSVSSDHLNNGSFREEHSAERKDVLRELQSELLEYSKYSAFRQVLLFIQCTDKHTIRAVPVGSFRTQS
jgi:hypothetical protein